MHFSSNKVFLRYLIPSNQSVPMGLEGEGRGARCALGRGERCLCLQHGAPEVLQGSRARLAGCRSPVYVTARSSAAPLLKQCPNACRIGGSDRVLLAAQRQNPSFLQPVSSAPRGASAPRSSRGQRPSPRAWPEPEPAPGSVCRVLRPHLAGSGVSERGELRARDSAWLGSRAPCYTPQRYVRGDD